jgi:hypothetical protein
MAGTSYIIFSPSGDIEEPDLIIHNRSAVPLRISQTPVPTSSEYSDLKETQIGCTLPPNSSVPYFFPEPIIRLPSLRISYINTYVDFDPESGRMSNSDISVTTTLEGHTRMIYVSTHGAPPLRRERASQLALTGGSTAAMAKSADLPVRSHFTFVSQISLLR